MRNYEQLCRHQKSEHESMKFEYEKIYNWFYNKNEREVVSEQEKVQNCSYKPPKSPFPYHLSCPQQRLDVFNAQPSRHVRSRGGSARPGTPWWTPRSYTPNALVHKKRQKYCENRPKFEQMNLEKET